MNAKDTIIIGDHYEDAIITDKICEKYARRLVQEYLKENTRFSGGWICFREANIGGYYRYTLWNPYYQMAKEFMTV